VHSALAASITIIKGEEVLLADLESKNMEGRQAPIRIQVPTLENKKLSFCDGSVSGFEAWAKKLPMANVGAAAKMLFQATREMNVTDISSADRYKMLEIIRTQVYSICNLLSKRFLNQPVMLSESDVKIVQLAQTLQMQLANGYKHIVVYELSKNRKDTAKVLTFAIHRAITDLSHTILRSLQLYSQPPQNSWVEIHQLYALSESKGITQYAVKDHLARYINNSTIEDVYSRILLLGCCKPNKLRQLELSSIYRATELWSRLVKVTIATDHHALFVFPQHRDTPPIYRSLAQQSATGVTRGLNTLSLVMALQKHMNNEGDVVTIPDDISDSVVKHLAHAWGDMTERSFRRTQDSGQVELAMGFLSGHYYSANEQSFPHLLQRWNVEIPETKASHQSSDVWDQSFDAGNNFASQSENISFDSIGFVNQNKENVKDDGPKGKSHDAVIINSSPGGYCVAISNPPSSVQTGELVVIKEKRINNWSVGCIRWIRTQHNQATQIGLELIAPKAEAVAIRILNKTGDNGELMRGLRVPALPAAGQDETLILPTVPFKLGSKAELVDRTSQQRIQLYKRHTSSRSFVQYSFKSLTQISTDTPNKSSGDDEFASIWDKL
jgi:hypothetical protein